MIVGFRVGAEEAEVDAALRALGFRLRSVGPTSGAAAVYASPDGEDLAVVRREPGSTTAVSLTGHAPERWLEPLTARLGEVEASGVDELSRMAEAFGPRPHRPRLSGRIEARVERSDGKTRVRLWDPDRERAVHLAPDEWRLLPLADGTRDGAGIRLAAAREGEDPGRAALDGLLARLSGAGMLADGLPAPPRPSPVPAARATPPGRPLEVLAGFSLRCDGRGSCCRFYGGVPVTADEAERARETWPERAAELGPDLAFTPATGARASRRLALATIDGGCLFLEGDGCGLHRRGGADAKPFPCRSFPATYVDDGVAVRVSVMPECACVFASLGADDGEPLVPAGAARWADLPDGAAARVVDAPFALSDRRVVDAEAARALTSTLSDAFADAPGDPAAVCFALADALEGAATLDEVLACAGGPSSLDGLEAQDALRGLRVEAERALARTEGSRASGDALRWLLESLSAAGSTPDVGDLAAERFYLRALTFGHRLALPGQPLSRGLRQRAARLLGARAMAGLRPERPAADRWPLALLEAALRHRAPGPGPVGLGRLLAPGAAG